MYLSGRKAGAPSLFEELTNVWTIEGVAPPLFLPEDYRALFVK